MTRKLSASRPLQGIVRGLVFLIISTAVVLYLNKSSLPDENAPPIPTAVLSPTAPGYTDSRPVSISGATQLPYEFVLEGILFKGMPYPGNDPDPTKKSIARNAKTQRSC